MSPYIPQDGRQPLASIAFDMAEQISRPGDLAYVIFSFLLRKMREGDGFGAQAGWRGAMEYAVDEFYRRYLGPYEEARKNENGDVE